MSISHLLNNTMDIIRVGESTVSSTGAISETKSENQTDVPCLVNQATSSEREYLGREGIITSHTVYCEPDIVVTEADELLINGKTHDVHSVRNPQELDHMLMISTQVRK